MRWRFAIAPISFVAGVIAACGSPYGADSGDPPAPAGEAGAPEAGSSSGDAMPHDAALDVDAAVPTACDTTKPFGSPQLVGGAVSTMAEDSDAKLSDDELTIVFSSNRAAPTTRSRIYRAVRASTSEAFTSADVLLDDPTLDVFDGNLSPDGRTIVAQRGGLAADARIVVGTRKGSMDAFTLREVPIVGTVGQDQRDPFVVFDSTMTLYFSQNGSTAARDILVGTLDPSAPGFTPLPPPPFNTAKNERDAIVSADGLEIVFASDRAADGLMRLYRSTRADAKGPFGTPAPLGELAPPGATAYEAPTWLSKNGCVLYFSSDRNGTTDVWRAVRPR